MSLFLDTAFGQNGSKAPIWMMRQAGRYLPEYMAIKEKSNFWEMCRTPALAAEVSLQPVKRLGVDAIILFQDIMTPLPAMGINIEFAPGPIIDSPIRSQAAIDKLRKPHKDEIAPFVAEAIKLIRAESDTALIGFGGAPLTLASYLIQGSGSKDYAEFRQFLRYAPKQAHQLLDKLTELSINYLSMQVEAGAQAIQLFDSWAGIHTAQTYSEFAKPYNERIFRALEKYKVPRLYIAVGAYQLYPQINQLSAEVISVDWRAPISEIKHLLPDKVIQGNLDPAVLLGSEEMIKTEAKEVLLNALDRAHIFNLGHGIMRQTDPEKAKYLVDFVKNFDRDKARQELGVDSA